MIPRYKIHIGSIEIDSSSITAAGMPVDIRVDLCFNKLNSAELFLYLGEMGKVEAGDEVTIELGESGGGGSLVPNPFGGGGDTDLVFTGIVASARRSLEGWHISCSSTLENMAKIRANKYYEQQKAGDIVSDLASIASVDTGDIESGIEFPYFAIGQDRSLWEHSVALAQRNGFHCYADAEDKLAFAAFSGNNSHSFEYGVDILAVDSKTESSGIEGVEVYGESPASLGEGPDASTWLTKEDVKGSAGSGSGKVLRISDPALRNTDTAGTAAEGLFALLSSRRNGKLKAKGKAVVLGDEIELEGVPGGLDGTFMACRIQHRLSKDKGFVTTINWKEN